MQWIKARTLDTTQLAPMVFRADHMAGVLQQGDKSVLFLTFQNQPVSVDMKYSEMVPHVANRIELHTPDGHAMSLNAHAISVVDGDTGGKGRSRVVLGPLPLLVMEAVGEVYSNLVEACGDSETADPVPPGLVISNAGSV